MNENKNDANQKWTHETIKAVKSSLKGDRLIKSCKWLILSERKIVQVEIPYTQLQQAT